MSEGNNQPTSACAGCAGLIVLALIIWWVVGAMSSPPNKEEPNPSNATDSAADTLPKLHTVTYEVTGTAASASLCYTNSGGDTEQVSNARIPCRWSYVVPEGFFLLAGSE